MTVQDVTQLILRPDAPTSLLAFLMPGIDVTREKLFTAVTEVEKLAEWTGSRLNKAWAWRQRSQQGESY
jgi:hypothetical protein